MHRYPQLFVDTPFLFLGLEYSRFNNLLASTADHENAEGIVSLTTARNSIRSSLTWIECDLIYLAINSLFQQLDQSSSFIWFLFFEDIVQSSFRCSIWSTNSVPKKSPEFSQLSLIGIFVSKLRDVLHAYVLCWSALIKTLVIFPECELSILVLCLYVFLFLYVCR